VWPLVEATQRFAEVVGRRPESAVPLDEAAFLIAAHARERLDVAEQLGRLDELANAVGEPSLDAVCALLFEREGFAGNRSEYYDAENSYLDAVLDRRQGIPITLSVLTMEVARRVGIGLVGIGMPGHFLTRTAEGPYVYLDAFDGGRRMAPEDCAELFVNMTGGQVLDPAALEPVGTHAILGRMLNNLKGIALQGGDRAMLAWVLRLRTLLPGIPLSERRELAGVLAAGGRLVEAAQELETLADLTPDADASAAFRRRATALRAQLN
jgi:regulator of sirC expression with transglutaminase-like and TPR domain